MIPRRFAIALLALWGVAWVAAAIGLSPIEDETYYWTWSRALAPRYFDHPPGVAWTLAASTALFGDTVAGLRAPSLLAVAIVLAATASTAARLGTRGAVLLLLGAPMFAVGYVPGTHDVLLGAAMAIAALCVVRAVDDPRWSAPAGFVLAASVLIKHSAAVVALGVVLGLLQSSRGRARLARPEPWLGVALGLALAAPWFLAELRAGGGSIAFQAVHVVDFAPARPLVGIPLALGSMVLTLSPVAALGLWVVGVKTLITAEQHPAPAALAGGALALLVACVVAVLLGSGEANWPMPALAFAAPLVAWGIEARPRWARVAWPVAWGSVVLSIVVLSHAAHPWLPVRAGRDPTLRGAGFDLIAAQAAALARSHEARALVTRRYQRASLLRWHVRDAWPVVELGSARRQSQYDLWPRAPLCAGDRVVWVSTDPAAPRELATRPIGAPTRIPRPARPGGATIDVWWAQVYALTSDAPWSTCAGSASTEGAAPPIEGETRPVEALGNGGVSRLSTE